MRSRQPIAHTPNGLDPAPEFPEFFSKSRDMHIDRPSGHDHTIPVQRTDYLITSPHKAGSSGEIEQYLVLRQCQIDQFILDPDLVAIIVDFNLAELD